VDDLAVELLFEIEVPKLTLTLDDLNNIDLDAISTEYLGVLDPIGQLQEWIAGALSGFIDIIKRAYETIIAPVKDTLTSIWNTIQGIPGAIGNLTTMISNIIIKPIQDALNWVSANFPNVVSAVGNLISQISSAITYIPAAIDNIIRQISSSISTTFSGLLETIRSGLNSTINFINNIPIVIGDIISKLSTTISGIMENIRAGLTWLADALTKVPGIISNAISSIIGNIAAGVGGIVEWIRRGFEGLTKPLFDWFEKAREWFTEATNALKVLGANFMGFVNAVMQLPERLQYAFGGIIEFFKGLWDAFQSFIKSPVEWLKKNIVEPVWTNLLDICGKIFDAAKKLWDTISSTASWLWGKITEIIGKIRDAILDAIQKFIGDLTEKFKGLFEAMRKIGEGIYVTIIERITSLGDAVSGAVKGLTEGLFTPLLMDVKVAGPPGLTAENFAAAWARSFKLSIPLFGFALAMELPMRAAAFIARGMAMSLSGSEWKVKISLKPLGIGFESDFDIAKAIGGALYNLAEEMMKHSDKFYEPYWMGVGFWYGKFASMLLTTYLRNFIPIEFPTLPETYDAFLRSRVAVKIPGELGKTGEDIVNGMLSFMKIRGYSDYLLSWSFAAPEDFYTEVTDRFEIKRKIPLASVWKIPPPADVITMMIRDVLTDPKDFATLAKAVGYYDDIAAMYYLLHFKYPSPERLAEFYWRGVAGVLWYSDTLEEQSVKDFLGIKWAAKKPIELNYDTKKLNNMMLKYMKWHDYAPFSWDKNFPTDKSIIVELFADLPDKADYRWLARWGLLEHLSSLKVTMKTSIADIIEAMKKATGTETVSEKVTAGISLDVTLFSRLLEARGLHPYFAALTSVSEIHMALGDEMTLLRSGFIEMFRSGLVTLDMTEKLMSGLFTITFKTGYIDPVTGNDVVFNYVKPVFWLPAERRLLQLRAVMDRGYELWRGVLREVSYGVRRLSLTVDEAKKLLSSYADILTPIISTQVKALTNVEWKPKLDDDYMALWLKYGEILRVVEVKTWIRQYVTRVMAWLIYRLSYGWVKPEDFNKLVDTITGKGWLTSEEAEFFKTIMQDVLGVVKRETIPSPLTLASMAEYMVIPSKTITKILNELNVEMEYRGLYQRYIEVKPFKSDYKALLNKARKALIVNAITSSEWEKYKKDAIDKYGFRDVEIEIQEALADLDMRIENAREYVPTPSTLASMAEYLPEARNYISQVLEARKIKGVWAELWTKYIWLRPVYDNASKWASAMFKLAENFIINIQQLDTVFNILKTYGWEDLEVTIMQKTILAEQIRYGFSCVIGTPRELANMARFTDKATDLAFTRASTIIDALPVDDKTKDFLKQLWKEYISNLQADSEIDMYRTELISSYAHGTLDDKGLDQELDYLRKLGVPEMRLALIKRIAQLRRARYAYAYYY